MVARKLGFNEVKLKLAGRQRYWRMKGASDKVWSSSYRLHGGRLGTLELSASRHPAAGWELTAADKDSEPISLRGIANERLFEILSELLAEAWSNAANSWQQQKGMRGALKFEVVQDVGDSDAARSTESPEVVLMGDEVYRTMRL